MDLVCRETPSARAGGVDWSRVTHAESWSALFQYTEGLPFWTSGDRFLSR